MSRFAKPWIVIILLACALPLAAQNCVTAQDMDAAAKSALENTALSIYSAAASGNVATLRTTLAPTLNSGVVESAVTENKDDLSGSTGTVRAVYILDATGIPKSKPA